MLILRKQIQFLFLMLLWTGQIHAASPRIGLVLSGGGAKGEAHIGVLKVLEDMRIPIHAIAGTSMGALIGGIYASGMSITEMETIIKTTDWNSLFIDDPPRSTWPMHRKREAERPTWDFTIGRRDGSFTLPKAAISGQKIRLFLANLVRNADGLASYDDMPIPFRAMATNLENGRVKVFDRGPLAKALYASMSVPGFFSPLDQRDGLYVDGGLVRNLPIDIVRQMGVDVVIAVNIEGSYLKREQLNNVLGVTGQMITILIEQNVQRSLTELKPQQDVLINLKLGDITAMDFGKAAEIIPLGEAAARKVEEQLRRYQVSPTEYAAWSAQRLSLGQAHSPTRVDEVQLIGLKNINPRLFNRIEQNHNHNPLDRKRLEQDLQTMYSSGDFERIGYRVERSQNHNLLIVDAVEKSWGPDYINFGLGLMDDHKGDSRFGLRSSYRQTWINSLGAEWNTSIVMGNVPELRTEFYQPLDIDRTSFVAPYLDLGINPLHIYVGNNRVARYDANYMLLGAEFGGTFGSSIELRTGPYWRTRYFSLDTGGLILPEGKVEDSGLRLRVFVDTFDSDYMPHHGHTLAIEYEHPLEITGNKLNNNNQLIGTEANYHRLYVAWQGAYALGADSLLGALRAGSSFGDNLPYYDQFALGGFLNITGYANEQFRGNDMVYGSLAYQHRIAALPSPIGRGLYLGASLEVGKLWGANYTLSNTSFSDIPSSPEGMLYGIGLFFGADTWLGPMYLGWGISGTKNSSLYVLLGR